MSLSENIGLRVLRCNGKIKKSEKRELMLFVSIIVMRLLENSVENIQRKFGWMMLIKKKKYLEC